MTDIVGRLRGYGSDQYSWRSRAEREAAAEIETLRAEVSRLTGEINAHKDAIAEAQGIIAELREEALRALPTVDGWQGIETAPHDAYIILCGYLDGPHDPRIKMGYWWTEEKRWKIDGASWRPIYWMPLPAPPS